MTSVSGSGEPGGTGGSTLLYWVVAVGIVAVVGAATGFRDEVAGADAWEHHRAVRVVAELGPRAGNPTYATEEPSIRYSPYTLFLASLVRRAHRDPWNVLSGAAVVNTALIVLALFWLLAAYGARRAALATLLVAVFLYARSPGYANTLALDDLPWHMVNPSAFALALGLGSWAAWRWSAGSTGRVLLVGPLAAVGLAISFLVHGMSGVLGAVGLAAVALAERGPARRRLLLATSLVGVAAAGLCLAWPYYPFARAILSDPNPGYWYNPTILRLMLTVWCLPCLVSSLLAIPLRRDPVVRFGLWGLALSGALTLLAVLTRSATLARLPLAGLIFAQVLTGVVLSGWRLSEPETWRETLRSLRSTEASAFVPALVRVLLPALVVFFAVPKLVDLAREPHLLRPRLARWFAIRDLQSHRFARYAAILGGVGEREVVMADPDTGWPVPSFKGRIVGALHFEYFPPDQQQRFDDATLFTTRGTSFEERKRMLERYQVRWILLDRSRNEAVIPEFQIGSAVARDEGGMLLVDARRWLEAAGETARRK